MGRFSPVTSMKQVTARLSKETPSPILRCILQAVAEAKEPHCELQHHIKVDRETVEVRFTGDWGKGLNDKQVDEEIKRFTETMIKIKKEQEPCINIDGETVEVMFTADWGKGLNNIQVEEEIERFTEAMIGLQKEQLKSLEDKEK